MISFSFFRSYRHFILAQNIFCLVCLAIFIIIKRKLRKIKRKIYNIICLYDEGMKIVKSQMGKWCRCVDEQTMDGEKCIYRQKWQCCDNCGCFGFRWEECLFSIQNVSGMTAVLPIWKPSEKFRVMADFGLIAFVYIWLFSQNF